MQRLSRGTWMSLVLWIVVLCGSGVCAGKRYAAADEGDSGSKSVFRARCVSRCLSLHSMAAPLILLKGNGSLGWCHGNKQCSQCLKPCVHDWKMKKRSDCRELCEVLQRKQWECVASCHFLHSVLAAKQGSCPPPEGASGFAAACIAGCDHDKQCSMQKKCCFNGCGHTCQPPKDLYKGVPLKPKKDLSFEESPSGHLTVSWSSRLNASSEPVVYILQRRWNFGIQPGEDTATPWEEETQTTELGASLSDSRPGRWYQFRVAAVNLHGTRGFTTPSKHIRTNRDPSSPPAPSELRVADMNFGPGRLVRARIIWDIPTDLDVPVHHYKVSWSWTAAGHSSVTKRRKTVRENQVELSSMRSNRKYSVEVQGVSHWGQTELKGPPAVLHFITQRTFSPAPPHPAGGILDVGTPFYQDGQLRVHVYWQTSSDSSVEFYRLRWGPESCTHNLTKPTEKTRTRKNFVSLQGLLFSCKYKVVLQPVSSKSRPPAASSSFFTPSCSGIQAKSPKPIHCAGETAEPPEFIRMKVVNLTASFQAHRDNVSAIFSWDLAVTLSNQQLLGYQATWMEVVSPKRHSNRKSPHSLISQSQILPPDSNVLIVSGLQPASVYRLEVRVISAEGEGPATSRTFQTPGHQSIAKQSESSH
ncbi:anosmin-1-like isoform X2 [Poeciliopsis prolifica]|uniref:anosmin-1-like isoform X2 n=1 Tax=Poeciliopsis prolifica TaxID=188132 RepID=UPI0024145F63|nr:anosmin-1-like isoform X2 [Poeciliopsis prolifica]